MNWLKCGTLAGLMVIAVNIVFAEEAKFKTKSLGSGLFMIHGVGGFTGGNIMLSVGDDGVMMIDDSMPTFLDKLNAELKKTIKKPIDYLINTHVHGDHIGNNDAFGKQGVQIVAHQNLRNQLVKKGIRSQSGMVPASIDALPVITFSHSMTIHINGEAADIIHMPHAHTDGDAIVKFTKSNIIHAGDVFFNGMFPYIDLGSGGGIDGYISAQEAVIALSDSHTQIVPGHGELATKKDLEVANKMLKDARMRISTLIDKGKSESEVVALNPLAKYHEKWDWSFITTEKMTRQVFNSLNEKSGASHGDHH